MAKAKAKAEEVQAEPKAAELKITNAGKKVLAVLRELGGNGTVQDIADFLGAAPSVTGKSIQKLETQGLVTTDGSAEVETLVALTSLGEEHSTEVEVERAKKESERKYTYLSRPEKGAPQMLGILDALEACGGKNVPYEALVERIPDHITTKQPANRVLQFYRKTMLDKGYVSIS